MPNPTVGDIAAALETWADPAFAESYDSVGLHVGSTTHEVHSALVALDLTPAVVDEAERLRVSMILTHHPLLFRPLKRVTDSDVVGSLVLRLVRLDIALYSIHTNLDAAPNGVSVELAHMLNLEDTHFLCPRDESTCGLGAIGSLKPPMPLREFVKHVSTRLEAPGLRYVGDSDSLVHTVAVCGGSGSSLTGEALAAGADAYITADIKYHKFFEVLNDKGAPRMALIDAGHYETERHTEALLCAWLVDRFPQVRFLRTSVRTSPVRTLMD